jgi:hypothetical protein
MINNIAEELVLGHLIVSDDVERFPPVRELSTVRLVV